MSNIRQVAKDTGASDIEAGESEAFIAASKPGASHNPVFLAKLVISKVMNLLLASDEQDVTQPGGFVTLLKDIIVGVILGVLTISTLIFLDHRNIVHFQSAHNFRNAAFQLLSDPETIANIEESSDLKFMTVAEYEAKKKEIDTVAEKLKTNEEVLEKRTKEAEEKEKEIQGIREEYEKLKNDPTLGLNKYCGGCSWRGGTTCDARAQFLINTYNTRPIQAKVNTMLHAACASGGGN